MSRKVVKEIVIEATPEEVWQALTDARDLAQWFPVEARVDPGLGGSIWLSWGEGAGGEAPITAWEPARRLEWTETRGPIKLAVDFHLEGQDGGTVVRVVQSGFGDGQEWDDEFHMVTGGWAYFMAHLKWYLERHRGTPRDLISFREKVSFARDDVYGRLVAIAEELGATPIFSSPASGQAGFTIASLNDAILFVEIEPGKDSCRGGLWLSTYGLGERLAQVRERVTTTYRMALDLPE